MRTLIGLVIIFCLGIYVAEKHPAKVARAKAAVRTWAIKALS